MQYSAPTGPGRFHEHRDDARHWVDHRPADDLFVKDRHHVQPVQAIRDVSARGVSLALHDALMPGEPVVIQLSRGQSLLEFYAYVCWCRCRESPDSDWQDVDGKPCEGGACLEHVAGLRVYGPQSLAQLVGHGTVVSLSRGARDQMTGSGHLS